MARSEPAICACDMLKVYFIVILFASYGALRRTHSQLKGELGEFQVYFRKIPLYQQKFLVVSVLYNSLWLRI